MAKRDRLVRHRDDDAVEVRQLLGELEKVVDVGGPNLQRDHDRVMPARMEALRHAGRRFHLRDRVTDGDVDARRAVDAAIGLTVLEEIGRMVEPVDRSLYEDFETLPESASLLGTRTIGQ